MSPPDQARRFSPANVSRLLREHGFGPPREPVAWRWHEDEPFVHPDGRVASLASCSDLAVLALNRVDEYGLQPNWRIVTAQNGGLAMLELLLREVPAP